MEDVGKEISQLSSELDLINNKADEVMSKAQDLRVRLQCVLRDESPSKGEAASATPDELLVERADKVRSVGETKNAYRL